MPDRVARMGPGEIGKRVSATSRSVTRRAIYAMKTGKVGMTQAARWLAAAWQFDIRLPGVGEAE